MKKALIISPHFPPVNAADMHRVRQLLPYLQKNGWEADVITVDPKFVEAYSIDPLLSATIPKEVKIHYVKAISAKYARWFGVGSLSMRSFIFFLKKGNNLISKTKYDLIFFSTTAFHVMALGTYWKRKFSIPFVVDIQDPWRNDFYLSKPKSERPPKFRINYSIDKWLEKYTMPNADGIMSVSAGYLDMLSSRYCLNAKIMSVIPFGIAMQDYEISNRFVTSSSVTFCEDKKNVVYIGRGGLDMRQAMEVLLDGLQETLSIQGELSLKFWFIGTDYAPKKKAKCFFKPVAEERGLGNFVEEITDRVPYFEVLYLIRKADALFIPGSSDSNYTASKIFPYLVAGKPLLAIFNKKSSVVSFINKYTKETVVSFDENGWLEQNASLKIRRWMQIVDAGEHTESIRTNDLTEYLESLNKKQIEVFNVVSQT